MSAPHATQAGTSLSDAITWVPREQVRQTAQLLFASRAVSYFAWMRVDQHTNAQHTKTLGMQEQPLGPSQTGSVTSNDLYRAILDHTPYAIRGLVGFGANLLVSHAEPDLAAAALQALEFCVYADLFMTPTAALADVVLPVATA
jgi:anaerobic selenocysteine-containing dehydrogenase